MAAAAKMDKWEVAKALSGKVFVRESNFDKNGLLYFLGTQGLTQETYINPHLAGHVQVTQNPPYNNCPPEGFIEHTEKNVQMLTSSQEGSTLEIKLPAPIRVTEYTLRHYGGNYALRNWVFEGSMNGTIWTELKQHVNDTSLSGNNSTKSWTVQRSSVAYTYFRLRTTGVNEHNNHYLYCAGLELYGQPSAAMDSDMVVEMMKQRHFERTADFDENGALFFLGSHGLTAKYINPQLTGTVTVTPTNLKGDSTPSGFIEHANNNIQNWTNSGNNYTLAVKLPTPMTVTEYSVRHCGGNYALRNWVFEGSVDNNTWVTLRTHTNDDALAVLEEGSSTASWKVVPSPVPYSHFRLKVTGVCSDGSTYHLSCSGLELYGMGSAVQRTEDMSTVEILKGREFERSSDFDKNGMLYFIGTKGLTKGYVNPHFSGLVTVVPTNLFGASTAHGFIEHTNNTVENKTTNGGGRKVSVKLPAKVLVTEYSLRHCGPNTALRNWVFEGSNDNSTWVELRKHENDTALVDGENSSTASWKIEGNTVPYDHYQIRVTGVCSDGSTQTLSCTGLELYGAGELAPPRVPEAADLQKIEDVHHERELQAEAEHARLTVISNTELKQIEDYLAARKAFYESQLATSNTRRSAMHEASSGAQDNRQRFMERVTKEGLLKLTTSDVFHLLPSLGFPVPMATLESQGITGKVLVRMSEKAMQEVFKITTLGARRRLLLVLREIASLKGATIPNELGWDSHQVLEWLNREDIPTLAKVNAKKLASNFESQSIDGAVLVTLTQDDLGALGIKNLGDRDAVLDKIEHLQTPNRK